MTKDEQYRELIDIIHDGSYHEEETAQDILDAGYQKIPCGAVVFTADERSRWEASKIEYIEKDIVREVLERVYRTIYINNTEEGYTNQSIDFNATVSDIKDVAKDYGIDL